MSVKTSLYPECEAWGIEGDFYCHYRVLLGGYSYFNCCQVWQHSLGGYSYFKGCQVWQHSPPPRECQAWHSPPPRECQAWHSPPPRMCQAWHSLGVASGGKYLLTPYCLCVQPNHCSYIVGSQKCPLSHPKLNIKIALWPIPIIAFSVKILLKPSQQDGSWKNRSIFPNFRRVLEYVPV